jgi:hypothetical protein
MFSSRQQTARLAAGGWHRRLPRGHSQELHPGEDDLLRAGLRLQHKDEALQQGSLQLPRSLQGTPTGQFFYIIILLFILYQGQFYAMMINIMKCKTGGIYEMVTVVGYTGEFWFEEHDKQFGMI